MTDGSDLLTLRIHSTFRAVRLPNNLDAMLLVKRTLGKFSTLSPTRRRLSSRASAVLSALDIPTTPIELPGVYDGEWKGSGEVFQSVCPATGEVLAHVKSVSGRVSDSA